MDDFSHRFDTLLAACRRDAQARVRDGADKALDSLPVPIRDRLSSERRRQGGRREG